MNWIDFLRQESKKDYFKTLANNIAKFNNELVYPNKNDRLAFTNTPISDIKVVVVGQDPYHGEGQSNGLAFSVSKGVKIPPSLKIILKEAGIDNPTHGDLTGWAQQGVLLLNRILTVEKGKPMSHKGIGWEVFTNNLIEFLNEHRSGLIYMLWGEKAKKLSKLISPSNHILIAGHPSPLNRKNNFSGCEHFAMANIILQNKGEKTINWRI
jgi:uracil-DNA glycosylase